MPKRITIRSTSPGGAHLKGSYNVQKGAHGVTTKAYLRGGPELMRRLQRLSDEVSERVAAQALLAGADVIADEWRARVPVKDGHYRNSITAASSPGKKGATGIVYPGDIPGLPDNEQPRRYAARLEWGSLRTTKKMLKRGLIVPGRARRAQPSARPAFDAAKGRATDAIADELRDVLRRVAP
jgi:HK97 gp10 family phage protein